jgi:hypothetical protein
MVRETLQVGEEASRKGGKPLAGPPLCRLQAQPGAAGDHVPMADLVGTLDAEWNEWDPLEPVSGRPAVQNLGALPARS